MRLRMKVWTDKDGTRYLCPAAFMIRDERWETGTPMMKVYAMNDEDTKVIEISIAAWDSLPFFYFKEDGECTDRPIRKPDLI